MPGHKAGCLRLRRASWMGKAAPCPVTNAKGNKDGGKLKQLRFVDSFRALFLGLPNCPHWPFNLGGAVSGHCQATRRRHA